jgi:RNA-dependent RNA polymerase
VQVLQQVIKVIPRNDTDIWHVLDVEEPLVASATMDYSLQLMAMERDCFQLSFESRYQLEVCLSHGYLNENNFTEDFLRQLYRLDQDDRHRAVGVLEKVAIMKRRFFNPMDLFNLHVSSTEVVATRQPPKHCTIARSATVTPTMIYFNTPSIEISNRVVRFFSNYPDRFLRVRFSDELGWGKILSNDSARNEEVYERVRQILRYGIMLGDRKYEFLAFGNSQFREHGAYFFAPTKDMSCQDIRDKLGDLFGKDKKHPAKYCARLGQNFSTTRGLSVSITIRAYKDNSKEFLLPDIKRNGFIFTDGVGKISKFLAKMIAAEFKLPADDAPAVFQFRLGGCKGVLAVDPNLPSHEVHVRFSQYKFAAIHNGLEIIRTSSYASASLNRQIILVLSALGVPDEVFVGKMDSQLKLLNVAMKDENVAVNELQKAIDCNQVTLMMATMIQHGFMTSQEPFIMSLLGLWRSWTLKALKEKAKISVDQGAFLLGTVDETATLRGHFYDNQLNSHGTMEQKVAKLPEVFCYIDWKRRGVYEAVEGVCILARNPSLHPGDIRVVRAVDVPQLHHIHNAVVLPQTGDRDVSNMCSGGDLDGDDYLLIWDPDLIPKEWNHPPMDFTPALPRVLDRLVGVDDMTDFFVDYMKSDKLALIATTHLALADWSEDGVKDDKCKALAQLHSLAVDYPKSGVPVNIPPQFRKVRWPHFMEKRSSGYTSKKILGQLYDLVEREEFSPKYHHGFDQRILQHFTPSEVLLKRAAEIKRCYDSRIKRIMAQHGIATEFEVWSGFVMRHKKEVKDYKFGEELGTLMEALRTSFREECEKAAGGRDPAHLHTFISAMYAVTEKQVQEAREQAESDPEVLSDPVKVPLISFPWLFLHELGSIASGRADMDGGAHRIQGSQKRHHTMTMLGEGEISSKIQTDEGIVPLGGVFRAFSDKRSGSISDINSERGNDDLDDHMAMMI